MIFNMASWKNIVITEKFLKDNPRIIFVFGDNTQRVGYGGAAILRDNPQSYGFITKKFPDNRDESFYRPKEYAIVFFDELVKLRERVQEEPFKYFYISQLGAGLANKYNIWENIIKNGLEKNLKEYPNVIFLWDEN
jgi:hypothetical protein